jgi:PAS domain S-box-containing protein
VPFPRSSATYESGFPSRLLTFALALTLTAFASFGWLIVDLRRDAQLVRDRTARIEELRGIVRHYGEVLVGSVRLAASTGDPKWEERYREFEPALMIAIDEVKALAGTTGASSAARLYEENLALVEMENRAFALVREGRMEEARAIVFGAEYEQHDVEYAGAVDAVIRTVWAEVEKGDRHRRFDFLLLIGAIVVVSVSVAAWVSVIRNLGRWRDEVEGAVRDRTAAEHALRQAHDDLEVRVEQRTRELEEAAEALRASNELFHQLADNIGDVFWVRSPDSATLRYISPAFEEIWGRSRESLYANPDEWIEFVFPEDRERVQSAFGELGTGAESVDTEYRVVRPDGEIRWVHLRAFEARDDTGELISILGVVRDITERRKLDERLIQSRRLETVGRLAGGIAHEFNSILTAIIGQSEFLLTELPAGSPGAARVVAIRSSAGRAATLTAQLLAYGRKQILEPVTFDLNRTVASMEGALRNLVGKWVDLRIVLAGDAGAVRADPGQIEHVIVEMASNARAAMPGGGKLTLETAIVTFGEDSGGPGPDLEPGEYVMLAITDTGTGMSEEVRARIFEPFFTTRKIGEGAGLGLATCEGIIRQSGGHVSVYSEIGRGTVFKIFLPRARETAEERAAPRETPGMPGGAEVILLVEDDPALREMSAELLRRLGYDVLVADDGASALKLLDDRGGVAIDLLFTDVVMPLVSGTELAERIQVSHPATRTLFTSAYTANAISHQQLLSPGAALLQKPFTPRGLALKVREVLDQRSDPPI